MPTIVRSSISAKARSKQNFRFLLNASLSAQVLAVGRPLEHWMSGVSQTCFVNKLPDCRELESSFKLVLYHSGSASGRSGLREDLKRLKQFTEHGGSVVIFGEQNRISRVLKTWFDTREEYLFQRIFRHTSTDLKAEITNAGMRVENTFITKQSICVSDEFNQCGVSQDESEHPKVGAYLFCVGSQTLEESGLLRLIEKQVFHDHGLNSKSLILDRFILRQRGAMLLFTSESDGGQGKYVSRVVSDDGVEQIVRRNQSFLHFLYGRRRLPDEVLNLLPIPFGNSIYPGCNVFTESRLLGELAWLHCKGRYQHRLYQQSIDFLTHLYQGTGLNVKLNRSRLEALFLPDLDAMLLCKVNFPEIARLFSELVERITVKLTERNVVLSASHGDYGYGNILICPVNGDISGVIDWDTGRHEELPEVDHLNLLVQKYRIENGSQFFPAFSHLFHSLLKPGGEGRYDLDVKLKLLGEIQPVAVLATMLIRYMSRAASYPDVFTSEQNDYLQALNLMLPVVKS